MTRPIRPIKTEPQRAVAMLQRQQQSQTRAVGSGRPRPTPIKAGPPTDADYTAATMPPIGFQVYDTVNSKIWVRHAVGVWKGVVVA